MCAGAPVVNVKGSKCHRMLQRLTLLMLCDSGAGGRSRCDDRGVPGRPAEPQLERPESCALFKGENAY